MSNKILKKIAYNTGIISSDSLYSSEEEKYIPTEQDIKDSLQPSFKSLIKPIKQEIDKIITFGIKDFFSAKFRHYIHKHKNDKNLQQFIFDNLPYGALWNNEIYSIIYEFPDQFLHSISLGQVQKEFEQYVRESFNDLIISLINLYKNETVLTEDKQLENKDYQNNKYIRRPDQLVYLIDDIGDTIQLDQSFNINYKCRDSAFIFVKGKAYVGGSHINLMQKYLKQNNIDDPYYFNLESINKLKLPYSYGHIYRGIVLISAVYYTSAEQVKDALLKEGKYKVYDYNIQKQTLYRLANLK